MGQAAEGVTWQLDHRPALEMQLGDEALPVRTLHVRDPAGIAGIFYIALRQVTLRPGPELEQTYEVSAVDLFGQGLLCTFRYNDADLTQEVTITPVEGSA